jgi:C-terminal processing protease CtpA/Prc
MSRPPLPRLLLALGLLACTASAAPSATPALPSSEERLASLARLWGQVKYRHPALAYKEVDWDAALVEALPQVEAAQDAAAYAAAVQSMLEVLQDPATRVLRPDEAAADAAAGPAREPLHWLTKDVLGVDLSAPAPESLRTELARAKAVILDLRARGLDAHAPDAMRQTLGAVLPLLLTQPLQVPGERTVFHSGYRAHTLPPNGRYTSSLLTTSGELIRPQGEGKPRPILFLLDDRSPVDARVLTMKAQGLAQLLTEGRLDDGASVEKTRVELGGGLAATVRLSELGVPLRTDAVLPRRARADGKDALMDKALELARKPVRKVKAREVDLPPGRWHADDAYPAMTYPDREHRLLALFRLWNVVQLFYPYKSLMDRGWDQALGAFVPKFANAKDASQYALAVAEMSALLQDGLVTLRGHPELEKRGIAGGLAPFEVMELEGKPVVVRVGDAAAAPGLKPGQVLETLDGQPLAARVDALKPYVTASNAAALRYRLWARALSGPDGSQATLGVRDPDGQLKQVRFTRSPRLPPPTGEAWRLVDARLGYVDLTRLKPAEVAPMFEKLKATQGLVLDMRGAPQGSLWALTPYLHTRSEQEGAVLERNVVSGEQAEGRYKYYEPLPRAQVPVYRGRTVMLIDERTSSQAESTGLFLEAANGTTFVGSVSAGADGDVTDLVLPGGIAVLFSGEDVRHVDGRQLQRVGLKPQVYARPTLAGIRSGQDEVLDKALGVLRSGAVSGAAPR